MCKKSRENVLDTEKKDEGKNHPLCISSSAQRRGVRFVCVYICASTEKWKMIFLYSLPLSTPLFLLSFALLTQISIEYSSLTLSSLKKGFQQITEIFLLDDAFLCILSTLLCAHVVATFSCSYTNEPKKLS
jgi:hypothetical protein